MKIRRSLSLFLAFGLFFVTTHVSGEEQAAKKDFFSRLFKEAPAYLFCYFTGNGEDGLHLMYSYDGLFWQPLNGGKSLLKPEVGKAKLMRDPSIVRDKNGTFHLVWTTGWTENNIGYASSKDLINWSEQQEIPVMAHEPEVRNTWAPELFYDKNTFYIVWASTIPGRFQQTGVSEDEYNHRLYYTTTKDFKQFSPTSLFYDPGFNVIDPFILKDKGRFYLFMKNETLNPVEKNIRMTSSRKLTSFPKEVSEPISGKEWAEGPSAIRIGDYVYLYWDKYRDKQYGAARCKNLKKPVWEAISDKIKFPVGVRHGTVFKVEDSILKNLQNLDK